MVSDNNRRTWVVDLNIDESSSFDFLDFNDAPWDTGIYKIKYMQNTGPWWRTGCLGSIESGIMI